MAALPHAELQVETGHEIAFCARKFQLMREDADVAKWLNSMQRLRANASLRDDSAEVQRYDKQLFHLRALKLEIWAALVSHMTLHGCVQGGKASGSGSNVPKALGAYEI